MITFPFETKALRVTQPLGTFYVAVLPAELLLDVASSHTMSATLNENGIGYRLSGTQRLIQDKRLKQISDYIDRIDSAFPNAVIIAANYNFDLEIDQEESEEILEESGTPKTESHSERLWTVNEGQDGCYTLRIPSKEKLAAVIDGQHRLFAFAKADDRTRLSMELLCSIFLDLPKPFQAQLFATINSTQKPVDRSLTYELFGYNVEDDDSKYWTPDKLAVFLTRKLGTESNSPLQGRIHVSPKRDVALQSLGRGRDWKVSTAVIVDGILRLFSTNPKRDTNLMRSIDASPRTVLQQGPKDRSPLRDIFISGNDTLIHKLVENYVIACHMIFWAKASPESYIRKTVGVQALFDILRKISATAIQNKDARVAHFEEVLGPASDIDFSEERFRSPSGSGRSLIRRAIEERLGI